MKIFKAIVCLISVMASVVMLLSGCNRADDITNIIESTDNKQNISEDELNVFFFNVGKADCSLISLNGTNYLVDTGTKDSFTSVLYYLRSLGINKLDGIILSHTHDDHTGGLEGILQAFDVDMIYRGEITVFKKKGGHAVDDTAKDFGKAVTILKKGDSIDLDGAEINILGPVNQDEEDNENSLVFTLSYGNNKFLFTGDAQIKAESIMLQSDIPLKADVLKVGNHGEADATSQDFLNKVKPSVSVISTNSVEEPDTPDPAVVERINKIGSKLYVTQDYSNGISITSNKSELKINKLDFHQKEIKEGVIIADLDKEAEYISLRNTGSSEIDVSNWFIKSEKGKELFFIPDGTVLKANDTLTIASGNNQEGGDLFWSEDNIWHDTKEDEAILYDSLGREIYRK